MLKKLIQFYNLAKTNRNKYGHKHQFRQLCEMSFLLILKGLGPGYYLKANMACHPLSYSLGFMSERAAY